jgi:hypothetical protein
LNYFTWLSLLTGNEAINATASGVVLLQVFGQHHVDAVMIFFFFAGAIDGPASDVVFGQHHAGWGGVCGLYFFPAAPLPPGQTNHGGSGGALP